MSANKGHWNRRRVLKAGAGLVGAGMAPTVFTRGAWAQEFRNNPGDSPTVTFGFNVPQTGAYADEGADELRAYQLAVKHLNGEGDGGLLNTMQPLSLTGNGVLGKRVEFVTGDTQTKADEARASAKRMIEADGVIMFSGGSSSAVAVAVQSLAQEMGVVFMCGLTHSNDTTGKDRRRYGFRHFFNAYMSGQALGPVLEAEMGNDRRAYHLTADYTWGWTQEESIKAATEALGWQTVETVRTPLGAGDFSQYITPVLNSGADVLILNHYGKDMVNSLTQAVQFGLRDMQVNGKNFEIVVPLYSRLMAQGAGEAIKGILGTTNWHWSLQDAGSQAFVSSFGQEYGFPPSQAAHTCYVQALLYANACEMAGTFYPPEVIRALEDFNFDGMGNGPTLYRGEDHQCFKDVLVVRGNENPTSQFDLLEVVQIVPRAQVEYDSSIFGGELGPYEV
ncbi:MAG: substrate-binding protein [Alphaproteobacteria bacterium]